jgi:general stress protein 26
MTDSSMPQSQDNEEAADKIWDIVSGQSSCMLVTFDQGALRARPMGPIIQPDEGAIYFFTHRSTHKDDEIAEDERVCLTFADQSRNYYVSLSGTLHESNDTALKKKLWSLPMKAELPEGPDDPSVLLLVFAPSFGEFWDGPSSRVVVAAKMAAAIVTGRQADLGTNEKVQF